MTTEHQQPPKEHCGQYDPENEFVSIADLKRAMRGENSLRLYSVGYCVCEIHRILIEEGKICSRLHPAPRPPCEECIYQAQAAERERKAREDVLQQVIDYCNKEAKENPDDEAWYDSTMEKVADYCESLRSTQQQAGEP